MDPQRQYAQLLTLWSQGTKMLRRAQHHALPYSAAWEWWWRLGRRLVERRMAVLPVPLNEPALLVGLSEGEWFTLLSSATAPDVARIGRALIVWRDGPAALAYQDERWCVRLDVASALGQRGWRTLVRWRPAEPVTAATRAAAETVLGALDRYPALFGAISPDLWVTAAFLLRHPGQRLPSVAPLPAEWGFRYDGATETAWWERQDEDIVRSARRSPGGGAPGGRGVDV
ncbi:MAG: hypothetical protein OWU84_10045 [Firmicutes bacterium]|nr:hypothetical protein [Bacillota bacterium]